MKSQIQISVCNIANDHCHFKRLVEIDGNLSIPYDRLVSALMWLYQGLHVKVVIEQANCYEHD